MEEIANPYRKTYEFHQIFNPKIPQQPQAFSAKEVSFRAGFKGEELVELLYASADNDLALFEELVADLHQDIDKAKEKILHKDKPVTDVLVEEADALVDLLYFTYGSFVLMGIEPTKLFEIVHQANMGKIFPDGQPHYHPVTNKVLKPDNWEAEYAPERKLQAEILRQMKKTI